MSPENTKENELKLNDDEVSYLFELISSDLRSDTARRYVFSEYKWRKSLMDYLVGRKR